MPDALEQLSPQLRQRLERCRAEIAELDDLLLRGTVAPYYTTCGKKGCRCLGDPPVLHGPYYQWTSKIGGKTRTIRLIRADVELFERAIANARRMDDLVADWINASIEAAQEIRQKSRR